MKKIAIVYQSVYGNTTIVAEHIRQGLELHPVEVEMINIVDLKNVNKLTDFDGLILGAPTYMGSVPAQFKAFMDQTSSLWAKQAWLNKLCAGFTNSGGLSGDKFSVLTQMHTFF